MSFRSDRTKKKRVREIEGEGTRVITRTKTTIMFCEKPFSVSFRRVAPFAFARDGILKENNKAKGRQLHKQNKAKQR